MFNAAARAEAQTAIEEPSVQSIGMGMAVWFETA